MTTNATPPAETAKDTPSQPIASSVKTAPSTQLGSKPESEKPAEKKLLGSDARKPLGSDARKPLGSDAKKVQDPAPKPSTPPVTKKEDEPVKEVLTFHKDKFADYKLVRMYLLQEGSIQYDPAFPELVLNTSDKRGMLLPLTPFFKSRIGVTLDIVL